MWNLKYGRNEPRYKTEIDSQTREQVAEREGERSGVDEEFGVGRCKLLYLEWISNEVLLYSTGTVSSLLG